MCYKYIIQQNFKTMEEIKEVRLKDGSTFCIKVEKQADFHLVGANEYSFNDACKSLKQIGSEIYEVFQELKPKKGSVEFGVELSITSGKLTSMIVNGNGKANFVIKLEWES